MIRNILIVISLFSSLNSETSNKKEKEFLPIHPLGMILLNNLPAVNLDNKEQEFLKNHPIIYIGSDSKWLPYVHETNDKKLIGLNIDILNKINKLTGANFKLKVGTWKDILHQAKENHIDGIMPSTVHKEREKFFNFSIPFLRQPLSIVVKHGNPLNIKNERDLKDKTIVIQEGNLFLKKLINQRLPNTTIIYKNSYEDVYKEVVFGQADATINEAPLNSLKNEKGLPYLNTVFTLEAQQELVFSIRKDWPEAISILNKGIKAIKKEELQKLKKRWFGEFHFKIEKQNLSEFDKKYIKKIKKINICANDNYKKNISTDFTIALLKKIGLDINIVKTNDLNKSLEFLEQKRCDLISLLETGNKVHKNIHLTKPYINYSVMIITHNDTAYLYNLNKIKNKKIAILRNHTIVEEIKKKYHDIELISVDNVLDGLKKVQSKEVFAYVDLLPIVIPMMTKLEKIKINRALDISLNLSMAMRSEDNHLYNIIEKSLIIIEEKEKNEILNKLIEVTYQEKIDYTTVFQILILFSIIIFLIIYWNFQLKKGIKKALIKNKKQESLLYYYSKQDAMKDLVGNISHQWKQPINELSSVLLFLETKLYLNKIITETDIIKFTFKSRNIIDYLSKTVCTFSNFYVHSENKEYIKIETLVKQVLFIIEGSFKKFNIKIILDIKDNGLQVRGEELQQVILAILNNARNILMERKTSNPHIQIKLYKKNKHSIIQIKDNLGGIDDIDKNIFELGTSFTKNGTGLGLYLAKRIVEDKYKGYILVANTHDGALFTIKIPLKNINNEIEN